MEKNFFEPIQIIWHLDNICNASCSYCFANSLYHKGEISNPSWKTIVKRINSESTLNKLSIIGGEPLLVKELPLIIKNLRDDLIVNIDSNLVEIKNKWNDEFKKAYFCTTIDSIDEDVHRKTRGHLTKATLEGIEFLVNKGVKVMVVIVVTKYNAEDIEKTARHLFDIGVDKIGISRTRMSGKALEFGYNYFYDSLDEVKQKTLQAIKRLIRDYGKDNILVYNSWHDKRFFDLGYEYEPSCKCALFRACVDWHGFMYPCELMPFYWDKFEEVYGFERPNLKSLSIKEAFDNSDLFKYFREKMLSFPVSCESCSYKGNCNHGCRFYAFLTLGSLLATDVTCRTKSLYDVIGYKYYSPMFKVGRERMKSKISLLLKKNSDKLGHKIYDLGCGGGVWTYFLEGIGKEVIGIDNNKTMLLIAEDYKKLKNKKSEFELADFTKYDFKNADSSILLDNAIAGISESKFKSLLKKLNGKVNYFAIEFSKHKLSNARYEYNFNDQMIEEQIKHKKSDEYERTFFNKKTGAKIKITTFYWDEDKIKNILTKFGEITFEKETEQSYFKLLKFGA